MNKRENRYRTEAIVDKKNKSTSKKKTRDKDIDNGNEKKGKKRRIKIDAIFVLISLLASAYLIYSLLLLGSIEKVIRYVIIGIIVLFNLVMIINLFRDKKKKRKILKRILVLLYSIIAVYLAFNIIDAYASIENMNKTISKSASLVTLKSNKVDNAKDIKDSKIGISSTKDVQSYELPNEIIKEYKLDDDNELVEYNDYTSMLSDLNNKEIDYIFLPTNYKDIYSKDDHFSDIVENTKIITTKTREVTKDESKLLSTSKKVTEPFTILLLGVDSTKDGLKNADSFNGDSIVLVTFNPTTLNATMLSIPRDSYVPIACWANRDENKITHAASQGTKCMVDTVSNFTGITIDYYMKINFTGLVDLVNALGGVEVDVPYAFCEQNSKRKWGKNTIFLDKGLQTLNGEEALALARNRKANVKKCKNSKYTQGVRNDFVRGKNQQLVIQAIIQKAKKLDDISKAQKILDAISENLDTNMSPETILSFYDVAKDIILRSKDAENDSLVSIEQLTLSGSDAYIYDERSKLELYNFILNKNSVSDVTTAMKVNLEIEEPEMVKSFSYSINEKYEKKTIGAGPYNSSSSYTLVPDFTNYSRSSATSWGNRNGVTIVFKEVANSQYSTGQIIAQSAPAKKRVDNLTSKTITLTIVNNATNSKPSSNKIDCSTSENESSNVCTLPNFIGKTKADVDVWSSKFSNVVYISYNYEECSTCTVGKIIKQNISSGTSVKSLAANKTRITLTIAKEASNNTTTDTTTDDQTTDSEKKETE